MAIAIWLDLPNNPGISFAGIEREISTRLGLDLVGGTQTLLEADLPEDADVDLESMQAARDVVERRVNGLGVSEAVVQLAGDRRILVELPGVGDPEEAIATIKETALLEFVDFSVISQLEAIELVGLPINTTHVGGEPESPINTGFAFETVMTGAQLSNVGVGTDEFGQYVVQFELTPDGADIFSEFTGTHVGQILAIVLDKVVISVP
ncbi:MAG: hypothetical protein R3335_11785 [Anaerolineales bacterium]|nr:hypothetical protein [Anaerolineales bacterium]